MSDLESQSLDSLWTPPERLPGCQPDNLYQKQALEQYKLYVDMADKVSNRRMQMNTFMQALHTAVIGASATALAKGDIHLSGWRSRLLMMLPIAALMLLCVVWYRLVKSFDQLNSAKYKVIGALETRLPASPWWRAEWQMLGRGGDCRYYWPMTHLEAVVPWLILAFYALIGVLILTFPAEPPASIVPAGGALAATDVGGDVPSRKQDAGDAFGCEILVAVRSCFSMAQPQPFDPSCVFDILPVKAFETDVGQRVE